MARTKKNKKPPRSFRSKKSDVIYCIGDSHVSIFSGRNKSQPQWPKKGKDLLPNFRTYKVGPATAYNLCKLGTKSKGRENLFSILKKKVPKHSHVMLCFGEIDCRAHIGKQAFQKKISPSEVIKDTVNRYFKVIMEIKKKKSYNISIWNAIPSSHLEELNQEKFPTYGTVKERNEITKEFNKVMKAKCKKEGILFIDVFDEFVDSNLITKSKFYRDEVHLGQQAMPIIRKKLKKYFNLN